MKTELTSEEFIREKVRQKYDFKGQMHALWRYVVLASECVVWNKEYSDQQTKELQEQLAEKDKELSEVKKSNSRLNEIIAESENVYQSQLQESDSINGGLKEQLAANDLEIKELLEYNLNSNNQCVELAEQLSEKDKEIESLKATINSICN